MSVIYEDRSPDSPFLATIWRTQVLSDGCDIVSADMCWDMLIVTQEGKLKVSVWGPMSKSAHIPHTKGQEWIGIRFKPGTFIPRLSVSNIVNQGIELPEATGKSFWLDSSTWECPTYENVETFVNRLVRGDLLFRDPVVEAALQNCPQANSSRTIQRRFLRVTGLTQRTVRAIERAQQAASLLRSGKTILDTVHEAGYADQQTMTKSLKRLMGLTPAQIRSIRTHE
jgi:AraC-like DNA-binding protein